MSECETDVVKFEEHTASTVDDFRKKVAVILLEAAIKTPSSICKSQKDC